METQEPAVKFNDISKSYGSTQALKNFSLTIESGDFLGLLGPNGAGKTTAVHLATGLAKIQNGTIKIFGHDVQDDYQKARSKIGLAPQEANFDRFFSAIDCLIYQGGYFGIPAEESKKRATELLELLGLKDKHNSRPNKLSGGQKRRLLIAKALVHDPDVLILDEPTASLDVELRRRLWKYLKKLKKRGKTIILTTHYIEEVEALADTVAILKDGELLLRDSTQDILRKYGRYQYVLEVNQLPDKVASELTNSYRHLEVQNSKIILKKKRLDAEINDLFEILFQQDIEINSMYYRQTELEDIFMEKVYQND